MRFTSLVVELIRARPRLVVWIVVLCQAALWLMVSQIFYRSPPGDVAAVLAFGREYQVGSDLGPPLSFWLADIAYRLAGNHMIGVYLLAQLCAIAPIWALLLLHSWQLIGQNRRNVWFAWSIEAGLLLLATSAAPLLLLLLAGFALATPEGRQRLRSVDPLFALLVILVLALPYLIWLLRADALALPHWPAVADLSARATHWGWLLAGLLLAMAGLIILVGLNSGWFSRSGEEAPIIFRPP